MNNVLLEIRNLSKVYESKGVSVQALSDINLTVYQGETIGIVGEYIGRIYEEVKKLKTLEEFQKYIKTFANEFRWVEV